MAQHAHPSWWGGKHTSTWDRVKEALARDWEQTKADFSNEYGKDLEQGVTDTVKQAIGSAPIPAPHQKTPHPPGVTATPARWSDAEAAIRYGYAASNHYASDHQWNDEVESKLAREWSGLYPERSWSESRGSVRYGWERARRDGNN